MFVFNREGINARADSDQVRGFTKSKKKHMLKISAAIWKAEIPIHYTTLSQVEQALLQIFYDDCILKITFIAQFQKLTVNF